MDKNLLKKRHTMRVNSLSEQSSEDKAFFMSAPDIMVYFDHQENQQAVKRKQSQVHCATIYKNSLSTKLMKSIYFYILLVNKIGSWGYLENKKNEY